jgi:mono/diheme cytochrome c family protein
VTHRSTSGLTAAALILAALASSALADEPGGGATKPKVPVTGEEVYVQVCQSCHMADGKGATGAATIPALANNPRLKIAAYPITLVEKGKGAMPWFSDTLSPAQVANVVGYIRTHFGNAYDKPVTEADVPHVAAPVATH